MGTKHSVRLRERQMEIAEVVIMEASGCRRKVNRLSCLWIAVGFLFLHWALTQPVSTATDEIRKPLYDRNQYKFVELPNRLKAVVISVPDCDRAAASISVHAGAHQDPDDVAGTAHLLEHMLFLGSKRYPEPAEYHQFVWTHGGTTNAHTSASKTTFYFEISPDLLEEALDRLAQGFTAPLLQPDMVNQEIEAVHKEFNYRKTLDSRRLHMLLSHTFALFEQCEKNSPFHYFPGDRRNYAHHPLYIVSWVNSRYSANLMTLAVAGREPVEALQALVMRLFSDVPNFDKPTPVVPQCSVDFLPFPSSLLGTVTYVVPIADLHQAIFVFYIPPSKSMLDAKPDLLINSLLRHNCPTCLVSKLEEEQLIRSLHVDTSESESCSRIEIVLNLTDKGSQSIARIGELLFLYIRHLTLEPIDRWRWKEIHDLAEIEFLYKDQSDPVHLVSSISENLLYYSPAEVLRGDSYTYVFDEQQIASILGTMKPSNARVLLVDKKFEPRCTKELSGYPVKYVEETLPAATTQLWSTIENLSNEQVRIKMNTENMSLPVPNPFIPTDLTVARPPPDAPRFPKLLDSIREDVCKDMSCKIYFKQDTTFRVPKATVSLLFYWEPVCDQFCDAFFTKVIVASVAVQLQKVMADAELAGYVFKVEAGVERTSPFLRQIVRSNAVVVRAKGFSDKLPEVFRKGLAFVASCVASGSWKEVLPVAVEAVRKQLRADVFARNPVRQASDALASLFMYPEVNDAEFVKYSEGKTVTAEAMEAWLVAKRCRAKFAVEGLLQGNMTEDEARELVNDALQLLKVDLSTAYHEVCYYRVFDMHNTVAALQTLPGEQCSPPRKELSLIRLRYTTDNILATDEQTGVSLYIQMGWPSLQRRALILLLNLWLRDKFFTELRTKQQLGYIVAFTTQALEHMHYLLFTVTSTHDVSLVSERIEDFIESQLKLSLNQQDFETIQKAAVDLNEVKHKNLFDEASFNFAQVVTREFIFNIKEQLCEILKLLTVDDLNRFMSEVLTKSPRILIAVRAGSAEKATRGPPEATLDINSTGQWTSIPKPKFAAI